MAAAPAASAGEGALQRWQIVVNQEVDFDYLLGIFSTDNPEAGAAITSSLAVISQFENQVLVAVPAGVWHRTVARRLLPRAALQKPVLVEVSASVDSDRAIADAARPVRLWIGLLNTAFEDMVTFEETRSPNMALWMQAVSWPYLMLRR